jgi:Ni/Fe-hydrogenase subunit HybB-like protein
MKAILIVIGIVGLALAGLKAFVFGEAVTGYGSLVPWGLWVSAYALLVSAAAGLAAMASLYNLFGLERFKPIAKHSLIAAIACLVTGMIIIAVDLGHPLRGFYIAIHPDFSSPITGAVWSYAIFIVTALLLLRGKPSRVIAVLNLLVALSFLFAETFYSTVFARPAWNSSAVVMSFVASALLLGVTLVSLMSQKIKGAEGVAGFLRRDIAILLVVFAGIEIAQLVVGLYSAPERAISARAEISSPVFWIFVLWIVIPLAMLYSSKWKEIFKYTAVLIVAGVLLEKFEFISRGFVVTPAFPELVKTFSGGGWTLEYTPSIYEIATTIGLLSAAVAGYMVTADRLKTVE